MPQRKARKGAVELTRFYPTTGSENLSLTADNERMIVKPGKICLGSTNFYLKPDAFDLSVVVKKRQKVTGKTFLHLVCELDDPDKELALIYAKFLLELDKSRPQEIAQFVNVRDTTPKRLTALQIAITKKDEWLIELLLTNGAHLDFKDANRATTKFQHFIYTSYNKLLLEKFDESLKIIPYPDQKEKDHLWKIKCDFTPIFGFRTEDEGHVHQTKYIRHVLNQSSLSQREILLHPLFEIFLHKKLSNIGNWIYVATASHVIWSVSTATFLYILYTSLPVQFPKITFVEHAEVFMNSRCKVNVSLLDSYQSEEPTNEIPKRSTSLNAFLIALWIVFWIFSLVKEIVEWKHCPNWKFYFRQVENWGQISLLIFVFLSILDALIQFLSFDVAKYIYIAGFLIAILLLQGQCSNFMNLCIFNDIFRQGIKNLAIFGMAFAPTLIAFAFTLHLIMPESKSFALKHLTNKILVMMAGDINYDEFVSKIETKQGAEPGLCIITFLLFVATIVLILQNLLIGLTVSDVHKLGKRAKENSLARHLEYIYIIENILSSDLVQSERFGKVVETILCKLINYKAFLATSNVDKKFITDLYKLPSSIRFSILEYKVEKMRRQVNDRKPVKRTLNI